MAVLEVLTYPDPVLKQISKPVEHFDDSVRNFISDLDETLCSMPGGVGIAAPQVGRLLRIVIVDVSAKKHITHHGHLVLVNPEITQREGMKKGREGCMSIPDFTGNVNRAEKITLEAQDENGNRHEYLMQGYEARAVQHELDHLDGLLFLDRLVSRRHDLFVRQQQ